MLIVCLQLMGIHGEGTEKFERVVSLELDRCMLEIDDVINQDVNIATMVSRSLKNILYMLVSLKYAVAVIVNYKYLA